MYLSRRDTGRLILAGTAALAAPTPGLAQSDRDLAGRLQQELNDRLFPGCAGQFTVTGFGSARRKGRDMMAALIRLDWPPGMRQRRFDASGDGKDATLDNIVTQALFEFGRAWPECVA